MIAAGVGAEQEYDRRYARAARKLAGPRGRGVLPFYLACGQRLA